MTQRADDASAKRTGTISTKGGVYAVVMAGGSGTRFWPLSRRDLPKQFLAIGGDEPLISATLSRISSLTDPSQHYVVAGEAHADGVRRCCPMLPDHQLLIEPCARNTAPCVALAALHIMQRDPDGVMIVSPADHHIEDSEAFIRALRAAIEGARQDKIVTLGVVPTRPETGYGYIRFPGGGEVNKSRLRVERFVEKPPRRVAERYVESGEYLWNSGLFIMSARRVWREVEAQLPKLASALAPVRESLMKVHEREGSARDQIKRRARAQIEYQTALDIAFAQIRPVSVDVGIMEGARDIEVIPISVGWSDVGHWGALEEVHTPDERGCVLRGSVDHIVLNAERVTIESDKLVAVVGVSDVIVVDTPDATLVCHREHAQEVKRVVATLQDRGQDELT